MSARILNGLAYLFAKKMGEGRERKKKEEGPPSSALSSALARFKRNYIGRIRVFLPSWPSRRENMIVKLVTSRILFNYIIRERYFPFSRDFDNL